MSKVIYGVYVDGGEYDSAYHNLVHAWSTKEAADAHAFELREVLARKIVAVKAQNNFNETWDEQNPDKIPFPQQKEYPKWTGLRKNEITQAMRDERNAINADNNTRNEAYYELRNERDNQRKEHCYAHLRTIGIAEDMIKFLEDQYCFFYGDDKEYMIEEVELD
jgi:hypothetical protein